MTCAEILQQVIADIEMGLSVIGNLRVHDQRIVGQLEVLTHVQTLLSNLDAASAIKAATLDIQAATVVPVKSRKRVARAR